MPVAAAAWPSHVDSGTGVTLTAVAIPSGAAWSLAAARGGAGVAALAPAPAWPITQKENAALAHSTIRLKTTKRFTRSTDQSNHPTPAVRRYHQAWAGRITLSRVVPVQVRPLYAMNCGGAATRPSTETVTSPTKVIRKPANRLRGSPEPQCTAITSGGWPTSGSWPQTSGNQRHSSAGGPGTW